VYWLEPSAFLHPCHFAQGIGPLLQHKPHPVRCCAVLCWTLQLQTSCAPVVQKSILAYVRDDTVPGVNKIGFPLTKEWDGVTYAHPIVYQDFSTSMATGENGADRGYVVHKRNSWKVRGRHAWFGVLV
jgi:hypothetical protein